MRANAIKAAGLGAVIWACVLATSAEAEKLRVTSEKAYGAGTFSAAVQRANSDPDLDVVVFDRGFHRFRVPGRVEVERPLDVIGRGSGRRSGKQPRTTLGRSRTTLVAARKQASISFAAVRRPGLLDADLDLQRLRLDRVGITTANTAEMRDVLMVGRGRTDLPGIELRYRPRLRFFDSFITGYKAGIVGKASSIHVLRSTVVHSRGGGGINVAAVRSKSPGTVRVEASLIAGNVNRGSGARGGGVAVRAPGLGEIAASTIAGNRAAGPGSRGGGIHGNVSLIGATVANNEAGTGGGLYLTGGEEEPTIRNTILAGNAGGSCAGAATGTGGNVVDDDGGDCAFGSGDLLGTDPLIKPLAENGGPTRTMALRPGSPAIGFALPGRPRRDQRGVRRDEDPDSGAFELR